MKKTQVALAALALVASTAVLADGVNVYGNLEAAAVKGNDNAASFSGAGQWGASVFGVKGSEDLGSGLKASFNLESGIDTNRGDVNNGGPGGTGALFNRAAWVSVAGGFGEIKLGNQVSPFIVSYVTTLGLAGNNFLVPVCVNANACDGGGTGTAGATGGFFLPNSFSYSFSAGGISGQVLRSSPNTSINGNSVTAGNVSFSIDALSVTAAISDRDARYKNMLIGGTYTMGGIKLAANFIDHSDKTGLNADSKTTTVGGSYALSEATTVGLNYSKTSVTGDVDPTLTNLSMMHALSKRTSVYGFVNKGTNGSGISYQGNTGGSTSAVGLGVAHAF
jgi:predicted porin